MIKRQRKEKAEEKKREKERTRGKGLVQRPDLMDAMLMLVRCLLIENAIDYMTVQ